MSRAGLVRPLRLSADMAGIIAIVANGPHDANSFVRFALARLASAGMVNIVDRKVSLTGIGLACLPAAHAILVKEEEANRERWAEVAQ